MLRLSRPRTYCEQGVSRLTLLVFLPLGFILLYVAYQVTPFYYNYFELENQIRSLIKVADVHTDEELRRKLEAHLKRIDVPIDISDIEMRRFGNSMKVWVSYEETLWFTWGGEDYDIHTFDFTINVEDDF